jgi:hypothetical protein
MHGPNAANETTSAARNDCQASLSTFQSVVEVEWRIARIYLSRPLSGCRVPIELVSSYVCLGKLACQLSYPDLKAAHQAGRVEIPNRRRSEGKNSFRLLELSQFGKDRAMRCGTILPSEVFRAWAQYMTARPAPDMQKQLLPTCFRAALQKWTCYRHLLHQRRMRSKPRLDLMSELSRKTATTDIPVWRRAVECCFGPSRRSKIHPKDPGLEKSR